MSDFQKVASCAELASAGNKLCLEVSDRFVVLVALDGQFYCLDDVCTHDGGPLGEDDVQDGCLVCPRHGAKFDVRTGAAVCMPATEPTATHEVRVDDGQIYVRLRD